MKNLKANIALALGYWLLYCALAQGGAFALSPWQALWPGTPATGGGNPEPQAPTGTQGPVGTDAAMVTA